MIDSSQGSSQDDDDPPLVPLGGMMEEDVGISCRSPPLRVLLYRTIDTLHDLRGGSWAGTSLENFESHGEEVRRILARCARRCSSRKDRSECSTIHSWNRSAGKRSNLCIGGKNQVAPRPRPRREEGERPPPSSVKLPLPLNLPVRLSA